MKSVSWAVLTLSLTASAAAAQEGSLQCGGTEPFWSLTITRNAMWLSAPPDDKRINLVLVKPRPAMARPVDLVRIYQTRRTDGKGAATFVVTRNENSCSDGMSEKRYAYDAVYFDAEQVFQGCCSWSR
jgi:uncharacterized membrane protein